MKILKRAVLTEELCSITEGMWEPLILRQFLYWLPRRKDFDKWLTEVASDIEQTHGFIYKSAQELSGEILAACSERTISRALISLVEKNYLERRKNPYIGFDNTYQYRPRLEKIEKDLNQNGYTLATVMGEDYPLVADALDMVSNGRTQCPADGHGVQTIPESTTETTAEIASSPALGQKELPVDVSTYDDDFEEEVEYVEADPFREERSISPKWRKPENYNWQHEAVLLAAMDATRLKNFRAKKEWSAWRKIDKSMVSLLVLGTVENRYPVEWVMDCINWARSKNLAKRAASGSFALVIKFNALISLINNEARKDEFVRKWLKEFADKEVEERFSDSDDGLSENPFADRLGG